MFFVALVLCLLLFSTSDSFSMVNIFRQTVRLNKFSQQDFVKSILNLQSHLGALILPLACWGEYGSELESGGDSGSVLQQKQQTCPHQKLE